MPAQLPRESLVRQFDQDNLKPRVRIRSEGDAYLRDCRECGLSEAIWTVG